MIRSWSLMACLVAGKVSGHPLCFINDKPTDVDQELTFCPAAQDGACCTTEEEMDVKRRLDELNLTDKCYDMYKQVLCGVCHSYSAHLYERLGAELDYDGMNMKHAFCEELVDACETQPNCPTHHSGEDYCYVHAGGGHDYFWSYPYTEPEIFEPGLNKAFPDLDNEKDFPDHTISMHHSPDGSMYWLGGQLGEIKKVYADNLGSISTVVDIGDEEEFYYAYEEGLLDFAFGPMFGMAGYPDNFYVSYSCQLDNEETARNRLSKFVYTDGNTYATRMSEEVLLTSALKFNSIHSAGFTGFKPSAYGQYATHHEIYWSTGDGGPQTDPYEASQTETNMLGSMMRILVPSDEGATGYKNPSLNLKDFDGYENALPEVCANGLRNPFRCSFDRADDTLYCGDVGHALVEEIDIVECGKNYGWSHYEGSRCQSDVQERNGLCKDLDRSKFTFPIYEYCHPDYYSDADGEDEFVGDVNVCGDRLITGHSVIGGHVYRGEFFSDLLTGAFIFGDSTDKNVYFIRQEADGSWYRGSIVSDRSVSIISFTENIFGEIMLITKDYNIYHMPCGDLCATSCLPEAEEMPTTEALGCFRDSKHDRALSVTPPKCDEGERSMSVEICASYCATLPGATYAGVQSGTECFCGYDYDDYTKHGELVAADSCTMVCTGDPTEFCGGWNAISVYEINGDTPSSVASLGCYEDSASARILSSDLIRSEGMTVEICAKHCEGSAFFGMEFASECFCSRHGDNPTENREAKCDMKCLGDIKQICGGRNAISIYEYSLNIPKPTATTSNAYQVLGCFADAKYDRVFDVSPKRDGAMTTALCAEICAGNAYFGTQYGNECWCGGPSCEPNKYGYANCYVPCAGDKSEYCGGSYAFNAYRYTIPAFKGCYADFKSHRVMGSKISNENMTSEVCANHCALFKYFGMQYGVECWCSDSSQYSLEESTECTFDCGGDKNQKCGGRYALSVYQLD